MPPRWLRCSSCCAPGIRALSKSVCCTSAPAASAPVLVESLTTREMDVLRLAAAGMSNAEIAGHLYLTTGTVKWFLNQIYGKLEVNRRTEAVAKARSIGLL